jgi:hydrogenase maturation protease
MKLLVLGIGNTLLSDEGVGVVAMNALRDRLGETYAGWEMEYLDGGTLSFTLAVPIEESDALIVLDAAMVDGPVGSVGSFEGEAMDRFLGENRKASVHEVGLLDLMAIARLTGQWPEQRALIGIRPQKLDWGEVLTPAVAEGVAIMCDAAQAVIQAWQLPEADVQRA